MCRKRNRKRKIGDGVANRVNKTNTSRSNQSDQPESSEENTIEDVLARLDARVKKLEDDKDDTPGHIPELVFRVWDDTHPIFVIGLFLILVFVQYVQFKLAMFLSKGKSIQTISDIDGWVKDGLLEWRNATRDDYKDFEKLDLQEMMRAKGVIGLTDAGFDMSYGNIRVGRFLAWCFILYEINSLLFVDKYPANAKEATWLQKILALVVLVFQFEIALVLGDTCVQFAITSSLDTAATIQGAIEAFFIMELDDMLIPIIWTLLKMFNIADTAQGEKKPDEDKAKDNAKDKAKDNAKDNAKDDEDEDLTIFESMTIERAEKSFWRVGSQIVFFSGIVGTLWSLALTIREGQNFLASAPGYENAIGSLWTFAITILKDPAFLARSPRYQNMKISAKLLLALISGFFGFMTMAPIVFLIAKWVGHKTEKPKNRSNFMAVFAEFNALHHLWIMYTTCMGVLFLSPFCRPQGTTSLLKLYSWDLYWPCTEDIVCLFNGRNPVLVFSAGFWWIMTVLEGIGLPTWGLGAPCGKWWMWCYVWSCVCLMLGVVALK